MGPEAAIDLRRVSKVYKKRVHALQGIDMRVGMGEIFGLLGPNGAGKSTLVKIMMTVVRPTHAEGTVLGQRVGHKPTLGRIGYLPENHRFPRYLSGRQVIEFFGALGKVPRGVRKRRASELLEIVGMTADADRKISTYSKGMAQRVGLAQAMVNAPDLIVLDEPTDGVDPVGRRDIREVLLRLKGEGRSVFINSHQLSELETICDRVAILVGGRVVKQGTLDELSLNQQCYEIEVTGDSPTNLMQRIVAALGLSLKPKREGEPPLYALGRTAEGLEVQVTAGMLRVSTVDAGAVQPLVDGLRRGGMTIKRLQGIRPTLEQLFIQTVGAS